MWAEAAGVHSNRRSGTPERTRRPTRTVLSRPRVCLPMTDTPLRVGIAGAGHIGLTVGQDFASDPRATVVAAADPADGARETAADAFALPAAATYETPAAMYRDGDLDAVLVATPHTLHYDHVVDALDGGLHVLCEKPLTTDLGEARDLTERAESGDETLMVGYQRHLNPVYVRARKRFALGDATPTWATVELAENWLPRHRGTWRTDPDLSGGGFLYDTGSHLLDALLWTTGLTPTEVSARMTFAEGEGVGDAHAAGDAAGARRVDDWTDLTVSFAEGAKASMTTNATAPTVREHLHIWDDDGAVYLDGRQWRVRDYVEVDAQGGTSSPWVNVDDRPSKAAAFVDAVRGERAPPATARDALRVTAVTEAAYEAAERGDPVAIDPDDVALD